MKVLALDSSGLVASVALVEDGEEEAILLAEYTINYKKTHSQTLLPMLDEMGKLLELQQRRDRAPLPGSGLVLRRPRGWDLR